MSGMISKDLFLATRSMDAYNRSYGADIDDGASLDTNGNDVDGLGRPGSLLGKATAIRAMFDDLAELGTRVGDDEAFLGHLDTRLNGNALSILDIPVRQVLTDAIVQFAGEMALRKISSDDPAFSQAPRPAA